MFDSLTILLNERIFLVKVHNDTKRCGAAMKMNLPKTNQI